MLSRIWNIFNSVVLWENNVFPFLDNFWKHITFFVHYIFFFCKCRFLAEIRSNKLLCHLIVCQFRGISNSNDCFFVSIWVNDNFSFVSLTVCVYKILVYLKNIVLQNIVFFFFFGTLKWYILRVTATSIWHLPFPLS